MLRWSCHPVIHRGPWWQWWSCHPVIHWGPVATMRDDHVILWSTEVLGGNYDDDHAILWSTEIWWQLWWDDNVILWSTEVLGGNYGDIDRRTLLDSCCMLLVVKCDAAQCYSGDGHGYVGQVNVTEDGVPCQSWSAQFPHRHPYTAARLGEALLDEMGNACRNVASVFDRPWCYTLNQSVPTQYCSVPTCC